MSLFDINNYDIKDKKKYLYNKLFKQNTIWKTRKNT